MNAKIESKEVQDLRKRVQDRHEELLESIHADCDTGRITVAEEAERLANAEVDLQGWEDLIDKLSDSQQFRNQPRFQKQAQEGRNP
jgi:hypothetical protein